MWTWQWNYINAFLHLMPMLLWNMSVLFYTQCHCTLALSPLPRPLRQRQSVRKSPGQWILASSYLIKKCAEELEKWFQPPKKRVPQVTHKLSRRSPDYSQFSCQMLKVSWWSWEQEDSLERRGLLLLLNPSQSYKEVPGLGHNPSDTQGLL